VLFAVDGDGCCEASGAHRPTSQTVNGGLYFAQRFANDWMWLDEARRLVNSNAADVHSWAGSFARPLTLHSVKISDEVIGPLAEDDIGRLSVRDRVGR
jgi:hypothetical protein